MILLYIVEIIIRIINIPLLESRKSVSYLIVCGLIINLNFLSLFVDLIRMIYINYLITLETKKENNIANQDNSFFWFY